MDVGHGAWSMEQAAGFRGHTSAADATPWPLAARPTIARSFFLAILKLFYFVFIWRFFRHFML